MLAFMQKSLPKTPTAPRDETPAAMSNDRFHEQ